jgi:hypothetical protein
VSCTPFVVSQVSGYPECPVIGGSFLATTTGGNLVRGLIGAIASESDIEVDLSDPVEHSALKKLARYPDKEPEFLEVIK